VSLREVIRTYMHTQPISVPSETVAYFEPPALIVYLMFRGEESRCNLYVVGAPRTWWDGRWKYAFVKKIQWHHQCKEPISSKSTAYFGLPGQHLSPQAKIEQRQNGLLWML